MSSLPTLLVFERCRTSMIFAAIVLRETTIVASPEWKSMPWAQHPDRVNSLKLLTDIVADCPELFVARDQIMRAQKSQGNWDMQLQSLLAKAQEVYGSLRQWKYLWETRDHRAYEEVLPPSTTPVISDVPGNPTLAWTSVLQFDSLYHANLLTLYHATLILILRFTASIRAALGVVGEVSPHEQAIRSAVLFICRSVDFHLNQTWTELGAFNLLFPVRMAYEAVGRGQGAVGEWLEKVLEDISAGRRGLWKSAKAVLEIG
jgi:hypothetical protein